MTESNVKAWYRMIRVLALVGLPVGVWSLGASCAKPGFAPAPRHVVEPADIVILGGRVWTGVAPIAPTRGSREPTAVAIRGHRIVSVGSDAQMRRFMGPRTRRIDARARRIIPGITDSHTHIIGGGIQLDRLKLRDVRDRKQFVNAVGVRARIKKPGEWILGGRWSVESWDRPAPPDKTWIDPVTSDVPVFLNRMDGHSALVNSAALRAAGIDANGPPDPKGGEIVRAPETGEPTGILKESAMDLVRRKIPDPSPQQRYDALMRALHHANTLGITSIHDMCDLADLEVFRRAERENRITVRVTAYLQVTDWAAYVDKISDYGLDSDMLRLAGLKGYMDGSMGSRTAYMREPYSDATPHMLHPRGQLTAMADPPETFQSLIAMADARGLQLAVHAIGDEGNHLLLDAYETAIERNGQRDARNREEHTQHLLVSDIPRFAQLGVVASMQPFHKADDGRYAETAIGSFAVLPVSVCSSWCSTRRPSTVSSSLPGNGART